MILPCEVAVRCVVPAVKALIAKELIEEKGLKQGQVAEILGISQSAVSRYSRKARGQAIRVDEIEGVQTYVNSMVVLLLERKCRSMELLQLFCQTCSAVRRTALMCAFCKKTDPNIKIEECRFCINIQSRQNER